AGAAAGDHYHRLVCLRVAPGRIPHPHEIATRTMYGHRDTRGICQSVLHSARIERAAGHDLPVAPTGGKTFRSSRSSPLSTRKSATKESFGIALAGEMWSVVMSSPSTSSGYAS